MVVLMARVLLCRTNEFKHAMETDRRVAAAFILFSSFVTLLFYVIRLFAGRREQVAGQATSQGFPVFHRESLLFVCAASS